MEWWIGIAEVELIGWQLKWDKIICWCHLIISFCKYFDSDQDPVVQSIVSLTISLRHKFVKQISAKVTNILLFFVEKM